MKEPEKIAKFGKPSMIFGSGQQKRLDLVKKHVDLRGKKILDLGCGIGVYTKKFKEETSEVWGIDVEPETIKAAKDLNPGINFLLVPSETLPFEDEFFDIVFLHEVLEHVRDDEKTIQEIFRVLKPGGLAVIFAPNRWYLFETHGIYLFNRYIYRLIPFINWLPGKIRRYFCPHVRVYAVGELKKLFKNPVFSFVFVSYVYPALDKFSRRHRVLGGVLRKLGESFEKNLFLRRFGISIFAVVRKQ